MGLIKIKERLQQRRSIRSAASGYKTAAILEGGAWPGGERRGRSSPIGHVTPFRPEGDGWRPPAVAVLCVADLTGDELLLSYQLWTDKPACSRTVRSCVRCVAMMTDSIMDLTTRRQDTMSGKPRAAKSVFSIRSLVEVEEDADHARRTPGELFSIFG